MPRLVALFALLSFLAVGVFGFVQVIQSAHQPAMQGCPFMPGEKDDCMMTALAHFEAWQHTFRSTLPTVFVLLLLATIVTSYFFVFVSTSDDPTDPVPWREIGIPPPLYQRLFARGILHPKNQ
ncbi:MAG: hypothetical protein ABIO72_03300 [Patescibacteria group bacterium]